jgi:hypothetical protein
MTVEDILNGLDFLAYEAEKHGKPNKEKLFYDAAKLIRAGQVMRDTAAFFPDADHGPDAWDAATKEDV